MPMTDVGREPAVRSFFTPARFRQGALDLNDSRRGKQA